MKKNKKVFENYHSAIEFLEYLLICLESGQTIQHGFFISTKYLPHTQFYQECQKVIRLYQLGYSFRHALNTQITQSSLFIASDIFKRLLTGLQLGSQLSDIIKEMSINLTLQLNNHLEELAYKAPIKMIFPLVIFIFPVLFILLGTKTVIQFVQSLGV